MSSTTATTQKHTQIPGYLRVPVCNANLRSLIKAALHALQKIIDHPETVPEESLYWAQEAYRKLSNMNYSLHELFSDVMESTKSSANRVLKPYPLQDKEGNPTLDKGGEQIIGSAAMNEPCDDPEASRIPHGNIQIGAAYVQALLPQILHRLLSLADRIAGEPDRDDDCSVASCDADYTFADVFRNLARKCSKMIEVAKYHGDRISEHRRAFRKANPDSVSSRREHEARTQKPRRTEATSRPTSQAAKVSDDKTPSAPRTWAKKASASAPASKPAPTPASKPAPASAPAAPTLLEVPVLTAENSIVKMLIAPGVKVVTIERVERDDSGAFGVQEVYLVPVLSAVPNPVKVLTKTGPVSMILDPTLYPDDVVSFPLVARNKDGTYTVDTVYIVPGISPSIKRL